MNTLKQFWHDEQGATAIEYGLIAGLIAVVIISALTALGTNIEGVFKSISDAIGSSDAGGESDTGGGGTP